MRKIFHLSQQKILLTHLETETHVWTKKLIFCHNKLFKFLAIRFSNLTKTEWKDLLALKNNFEIIIKEADKGDFVGLMNKPHYIRMIFQHLNDANTYQKTDEKCDNRVIKKMNCQR